MPIQEKIDIHAHVVPPSWRQSCEEHGHGKPDGMAKIPPWTTTDHIKLMDDLNISKTIISITSPGTHIVAGDNELGRKVTREANEYMASLTNEDPGRFGFFAALPLPDVEGALKEIDYALELGAVGFALKTNSHGIYLGDTRFDKVFEKLNTLKARVFIHPTSCRHTPLNSTHPDIVAPLQGLAGSVLEYFFDTTRAVTNLFLSGTVTRNPDITFIIPHCGSTLPTMLERISGFSSQILKLSAAMSSTEIKQIFKSRFYFDLAGFVFPDPLPAMLRLTTPDKLLYGSDYPYTPAAVAQDLATDMEMGLSGLFDVDTVKGIYSGNARRLLGLDK